MLIALRVLSPRVSAVGSAMAILLFLGMLSFLFTTPGVTAGGGFPVLSVLPGCEPEHQHRHVPIRSAGR